MLDKFTAKRFLILAIALFIVKFFFVGTMSYLSQIDAAPSFRTFYISGIIDGLLVASLITALLIWLRNRRKSEPCNVQ